MNGEKTPCMPSLVPVVQLAQPGKLFGRIVERNGALEPSRINRDRTGSLPELASGFMISNVAPSSPMTTVFIQTLSRGFRGRNGRKRTKTFLVVGHRWRRLNRPE
jgi:hypothetical protein